MCYTVHGIILTLRPVVHRVDAPLLAGAVMRRLMDDAVHDRIAHVHVPVRHINLCPQRARPIWELAVLHPLKQIQVLFNRTIAARAFHTRGCPGAPVLAHFFRALVINISLAFFDHLDRPFVEQIKEVRRVKLLLPLNPQPAGVFFNRVHKLHILFCRIGVVKSQVKLTAKTLGNIVINQKGFYMSNMQIAVGFGGQPGADMRKSSAPQVFGNSLFNKIHRVVG